MDKKYFNVRENWKAVTAAVLVLLCMILTAVKVKGHDMTKVTISAIGRQEPLWFFLWGSLTAAVVLINLSYVCRRLQVKSVTATLAVVTCALSFFLSVLYLGTETLELIVHSFGVMLFGTLGYCILMGCFRTYAKRTGRKKSMLYFSMLLGVLLCALIFFLMYGFCGVTELILLLGAEGVLFIFDIFFR